MTKISAKVIADSKNEFGNRITTMVVTFPRFILAELNTHRMMSRNSASSRAIPFEKMVASVENDPFVPIAFQKDHKGMQGNQYLEGAQLELTLQAYGRSVESAVQKAKEFAATDATKQLVNRQLEAYMWHTVIITATEWENFFALRCPRYDLKTPVVNTEKLFGKSGDSHFRSWKDVINGLTKKDGETRQLLENTSTLERLKENKGQAEIHMMELAEQMWDAMNESTPKELKAGDWHTPFSEGIDFSHDYWGTITPKNEDDWVNEVKLKISTARCARVSYTVVGEEDKPINYENDIRLHDRLIESKHASPFEHCAQSMNNTDRSRNFLGGWKQYREIINL